MKKILFLLLLISSKSSFSFGQLSIIGIVSGSRTFLKTSPITYKPNTFFISSSASKRNSDTSSIQPSPLSEVQNDQNTFSDLLVKKPFANNVLINNAGNVKQPSCNLTFIPYTYSNDVIVRDNLNVRNNTYNNNQFTRGLTDTTVLIYYGHDINKSYFKTHAPFNSVSGGIVDLISSNSYILPTAARTSAGVYKPDGTLVRTLWSGVMKDAGTYEVKWDGTDDFQQPLPPDNYSIKVLYNNVQYSWQGTIGNTSKHKSGDSVHRSLDPVSNIVIIGNNAYYTAGYDEATPSMFQFSLNAPQVNLNPFAGYSNQTTDYACTDGKNIYWTAWDNYNAANSWVFATKISDNSLVGFSRGSTYQAVNGKNYDSVIDFKSVSARPSGISASSNYIFVSYKALGYVTVLNKITGAFVKNINLTTPSSMAVDGSSIWIVTSKNTLRKYVINSNGSLGSSSTPIAGLSSPVDVRVNGTMLAVVDGGSSQQIKTFSTSTGTSVWTFGQTGGILNSPVVTNDRFGFWQIDESTGVKKNRGGIAFAADGSFWIADPSNKRMSHYDGNRNYLESIIYQGKTYTCYVDPNNHSRVIGNLQEFQVDYTYENIQNAWIQKYNWEGNFLQGYNLQDGVRDITTLFNGRTYGLILRHDGQFEVIELSVTSGIRYTAILFPSGTTKMYSDGTVYTVGSNGLNETETWKKSKLLGFDAAGNPSFSLLTTILTNSVTDIKQPRLSGAKVLPWEVTSSGILVNFRGNRNESDVNAYHLGGMNKTTGQWVWKTSIGTHWDYAGDYPTDGFFDDGQGSGVQMRGNVAMALERNIFWGYNGEFWHSSEVNKWNHYYDNGLFVGQYGKTGPQYDDDPIANAAFAGNAFSPAIVKEGGDYYMYHNDESVHGGLLRWKITGLNTIQEKTIPITNSFVRTNEAVVSPGIDLMAGLPFNSSLINTAGWTINPVVSSPNWTAKTNYLKYNKRNSPDLYVTYYPKITGSNTISRDLGANVNLSRWNLTGNLTFNNCEPNSPDGAGLNQYFDIVDNTGKIILRIYQKINYDNGTTTIYANNTPVFQKTILKMKSLTKSLQPLTISKSGRSIILSYAGQPSVTVSGVFDTGATMSNPSIMRLLFKNAGGILYEKLAGISDLRFSPF